MSKKPSDEEICVRMFVSMILSKDLLNLRVPKSIVDVLIENPNQVHRVMIDVEYNKLNELHPRLCSHMGLMSPIQAVANDPVGGDDAA